MCVCVCMYVCMYSRYILLYRAIAIIKKCVVRILYGKFICQENLSRDLNESE